MKFYKVEILNKRFFFDNKENAKQYFSNKVDNGCEVGDFSFCIDRTVNSEYHEAFGGENIDNKNDMFWITAKTL